MRAWFSAALVASACITAASPASAQVSLTIDDGYVTLSAKDATIRQILAEWERVGQTKVVNGDRITGTPLTLQLIKVPEAEALEILLRSVSGYLAAPRAVEIGNASRFDRILVMPTSSPPRAAASSSGTGGPVAPPFQPPQMAEDVDVEDQVMQPPPGGVPSRGPIFPQFPNTAGQPPVRPAGQAPSSPFPTQAPPPFPMPAGAMPGFTPPNGMPGGMPVGVSTPGMMVAPPQQPQSGIPVDPQP
jgi:hypothetical protein